MKRINDNVKKYLSSVNKIEYQNKYILLESNNKKYIYLNQEYNEKIYNFLYKIRFNDYYERINSKDDNFALYLLNDNNKSKIELLSDIYQKTNEEVFLDDSFLNKIYEKCNYNIHQLLNYYYGMQDTIEEMLYPKREICYLLINISSFYHLLRLGEYFLNKWFNSRKDTYQEVLTINSLDEENFVGGKIVNFSLARKDFCVFEIANYYQKYYYEDSVITDVKNLFEKANEKDSNKYLFYTLISLMGVIDNLEFSVIEKVVSYVKKTYALLLKEYEEDQETKYEMFNEKEKNI